MQTGTKISLAGHGLLVGWAVFGAWFPSEPLPLKVQEVALISAEEFAQLSPKIQAPELSETPAALTEPQDTPQAPDVSVRPERRPDVTPPEEVTAPEQEPPVEELPEPEPEPEVVTELPDPGEAPETPIVVPEPPEPEQLRPADRVAPIPVQAPEDEVAVDDLAQPEISDEVGADAQAEQQEATAPEAASDRIVTEANEDDTAEPAPLVTAPARSLRPQARPRRAEPEPEQVDDGQADAINDVLADVIAGGEEVAPEPSGPPLTFGEKDALRVAVSSCWNVGSLSSEALKTTVEVAVSMEQDGRPKTATIRMISSTGGSAGAAKQAFEAARRAIIRCGAKGFDLPQEKYDHWRDIVMVFNPAKMRIK